MQWQCVNIWKTSRKDNSVTIHERNLKILATELYIKKENVAAPIVHEMFEQSNIQCNLRSQADFQLGSVKTVNCGLKALRYLGPKIWNSSFWDKDSETLEQFRIKIKS